MKNWESLASQNTVKPEFLSPCSYLPQLDYLDLFCTHQVEILNNLDDLICMPNVLVAGLATEHNIAKYRGMKCMTIGHTVELGALESTPGRETRYFSNSVKPSIAAM